MQLVAHFVSSFIARIRSERGQDLLEYAMLGGLIAGAMVVVFTILMVTTGTNGLTPIESFATGIANCIDFTDTTPCGP